MAKPDNPAEAPVSARPPRPAQGVRLEASAEGNMSVDGRERNVSLDARDSLDAGGSAEPRRAARGGRHAARELIDDAFDTTRNLEPPHLEGRAHLDAQAHLEAPSAFLADGSLAEDAFEVDGAILEAEGGEPAFAGHDGLDDDFGQDDFGHDGSGHDGSGHDGSAHDGTGVYDDDGAYDDAGHGADGAYADDATRLTPGGAAVAPRVPGAEPRPGLAWARRPGQAGLEPAHGSLAGPSSRVPKFPVANLERPSISRLELTPSPVPRVALAPATGAVDISLVPGPHTVGSRNLPTLAAQHLVGRRAARRPAPALTVPPPAARESRAAFTLARDVRSSKGEIVLGLTIGLGVSLLLAGLGQAYLRSDPIADAPSAPARLESVMLSARPEVAAAAPNAGAPAGADEGVASSAAGAASARGAAGTGERATPARSANAAAARNDAGEANESIVLARATGPQRSGRTPQRATPARATRVPRSRAAAASHVPGGNGPVDSRAAAGSPAAVPPAAVSPAAVSPAGMSSAAAPSLAPPAEPPAASTPLTPAESAGLGLDLPL